MAKARYGVIGAPPETLPNPVPLAASVVITNKSGRFVTKDGSGNYAISVAGDTQIDGYIEEGAGTYSSTAAQDKVAMIDSLEAIFELPVDATFTEAQGKALVGKCCDLVVATGNIQQADIGETAIDIIKIVGYDTAEQTVYVKINATKHYTATV